MLSFLESKELEERNPGAYDSFSVQILDEHPDVE